MRQIQYSQLLVYLEDQRLINDSEYGFHHGCSTGDLLVYLTHRWAAAIKRKREGLTVSLDLAKTFDRVWHRALLAKLALPIRATREFMQVIRQLSHWTQHQGRCRWFLLGIHARECWRSPRLCAIPYAVSSTYQWHVRGF